MTEDKILLLPERVANQIAAGEVVNQPSSAVKELMENAIDAGATEVIVNVRNSGRDLIQIVDNGVGMTPNDARMAFERHATSKLKDVSDIYALHTFGFRGEALASIAAVAQVELRTRHRDASMGTVTTINGGVFAGQHPEMCECGSQFMVRNLFYNLPARRAFAEKSSSVKSSSVKDEFKRIALCNPKVAFELYLDDAPAYKVGPSSLAERIVNIMGRKMKKSLLEVSVGTLIVNISGYIGTQESTKKGTSDQFMFVNGRFFRSAYLNKAIMKAYENIIKDGSNPAYFIFLEVDPSRIDVNVHPQKTEVKFADDASIWQILNAAVRETLARTGVVPMMDFDNDSKIEIPIMKQGDIAAYSEPSVANNRSYNPFIPKTDYDAVIPQSRMGDGEEEFSFDPDFERELSANKEPGIDPTFNMQSVQSVQYNSNNANRVSEREVEYEEIESATTSVTPSTSQRIDGVEYTPSRPEVDIKEVDSIGELTDEEAAAMAMSKIDMSEWSDVEIERDNVEAQQGDLLGSYSDKAVNVGEIAFVCGRYAWCCIDSVMTVVDLRRAKERVLYDYYISTYTNKETVSQRVLFPIDLQLSKSEYSLMMENAIEFSVLGFDIEYCKNESINVLGLPSDVSPESADKLIYDLMQILHTPQNIAEEMRHRLSMVMARTGSQNIGRGSSSQMAKEIVDQLFRSGKTIRTHNGKTIFWSVTNEDIKRNMG